MRKLDRPAPPAWWDKFAENGMEELTALVESAHGSGIPASYFPNTLFFSSLHHKDIIERLAQSSDSACHVCGSRTNDGLSLDHYRPKNYAGNVRRDRNSPRHYWWLLYEWTNLQLLCFTCSRHKGSLFPVEGERAAERAQGAELKQEEALLLNPFDDNPSEHLQLLASGKLKALSDRGNATIDVYNLNRQGLVDDRKDTYRRFRAMLKDHGLERVTMDVMKSPKTWALISAITPGVGGHIADVVSSLLRSGDGHSQKVRSIFRAPQRVSFPRHIETRWVQNIRLRDFGPIADLEVTFPAPRSGAEPWLAIVGENGVGKSSFLKAITLALVSSEIARELVPDARELHNRNTRRRKGFVEVVLSDGQRRRVLFHSNKKKLEFEGQDVNIPVIALGAHRIASSKGAAVNLPHADATNNLFDPVLPLADTEAWLADPNDVSAADFKTLGDNLKVLIDLPASTEISRLKRTIYFSGKNARLSLTQMSDGFRSVIGLVTHIMKYLAVETPVMSEAEGTVLLDELELHLHPSWKIQIVSQLRALFPRVRFIITTHDPLCLRGLNTNESFVFNRHPETEEIMLNPLELRPGMDVDDLLTGGWFGLGSTYDRETDDMIHELSALSLKRDGLRVNKARDLNAAERSKMEQLNRELQSDCRDLAVAPMKPKHWRM